MAIQVQRQLDASRQEVEAAGVEIDSGQHRSGETMSASRRACLYGNGKAALSTVKTPLLDTSSGAGLRFAVTRRPVPQR